jgi:hypothetical protein
MSKSESQTKDRKITRELLTGKLSRSRTDNPKKNWLGHRHGSGAARIDDLLLSGTTRPQMERCRGAVDQHLRHLREEHGLNVDGVAGIYRFS